VIEVERKFRLPDTFGLAEVEQSVPLSAPVQQVDTVYLYGANSFDDFTPGSPVLRVRELDGDALMTLKRRVHGSASREVEFPIDGAIAREFIELLGWTAVTEVRKSRRTGVFRDTTVVVDQVEGLGMFIELEIMVESEQETSLALAQIDSVSKALKLLGDWVEPRKYDELLNRRR
jgi:adenylate cyclase class 2